MATALCMKRLSKEKPKLEAPNDDFFVFFEDDDNIREFHAYIIGPQDTLYEHKFVKLKIEIPDRYPLVPPKCKFIQHGGGRIHPNLYVEGKVCLSILGTWAGEPWALAMSVETVLITVRSLLDNEPYRHEPHQSDNPEFNAYVQYGTWTWLLLNYLQRETNEVARTFLRRHVARNGDKMLHDLKAQQDANQDTDSFTSCYGGCGSTLIPNYAKLIKEVSALIRECQRAHPEVLLEETSKPKTSGAVEMTPARNETMKTDANLYHDRQAATPSSTPLRPGSIGLPVNDRQSPHISIPSSNEISQQVLQSNFQPTKPNARGLSKSKVKVAVAEVIDLTD